MNKIYISTALIATLLSVGCWPFNSDAETKSETVATQIDKAQDVAKEAEQDMHAYSYEQKNEFVEAMKKKVAALEAEIKELSSMIETSSDKIKAEAEPKLAKLIEQSAQLNKDIEKVAKSTPSTWDGIKADSNKAYQSLKSGINQARQWTSEVIAPDAGK